MAENRWAMGVAEGRQRPTGDAFVRYSPQQLGAAMVGPAMAEPLLEQACLPVPLRAPVGWCEVRCCMNPHMRVGR